MTTIEEFNKEFLNKGIRIDINLDIPLGEDPREGLLTLYNQDEYVSSEVVKMADIPYLTDVPSNLLARANYEAPTYEP
jgi:hypothetical protein